ncbi:reverse transcriptase [Phytophthora megakarya]|uniref:Reverse transcriptase n=1 Tax=Phytophthora megakarya TaxID=4795 RepID=A0A225V430_9STRA|nr:reverse transcriptase [Phytophthora megakarya]
MQLRFGETAIPKIELTKGYKYLGVADSYDPGPKATQLTELLTTVKRELATLCRSPLAPSQILKSIKVYLYPKLEYCLRHLRPPQAQLQGLLRLPKSATTSFFYAPTSKGGLGLLPLTDCHRVPQIAHGWQMLHSDDECARFTAINQLKQVIDKRYHLDRQH